MSNWLLNDDKTDVEVVRPSGYGWVQADPEHKSRRKKRPLGFVHPEPPEKSRPKTRPSKRSEKASSALPR